jgi:integrase
VPNSGAVYPTRLRDQSVLPVTHRRYAAAVREFARWCGVHGERVVDFVSLDRVLSWYFEWGYENGELTLSDANYTFCGVLFYWPRVKGHLVESNRCRLSWSRLYQLGKKARPPLSWELTVLVAATMLSWNRYGEAVATLLAFDCYLRISEYANMKVQHLSLVGGKQGFVSIVRAKTGSHQSVTLGRAEVASILRAWLQFRHSVVSSGDSLFGFSAEAYRALFGQVMVALGVDNVGFVPHCLRHGGATCDAMNGVSVESILLRGRWMSSVSARVYINQGRSMLVNAALPPALLQRASVIAGGVVAVFAKRLRPSPSLLA